MNSRRLSPNRWAAVAAGVVVLVIGGVGLFASLQTGTEPAPDPATITTLIEGTGALPVAVSVTQARSDGDVDVVLALLAEDAVVDMGPAASKGDVAMEMRWQEATGLAFSFDRCEPADTSLEDGTAEFSCFVSWTGAVANSLGHGTDTYEYSIRVVNDKITSAALVDLGEYSTTTWRPFRDWMRQNHDSEIAVMYTPEWHAALTDESIGLWALRTAEFVGAQAVLSTTTTEAPKIFGFREQGKLEVTWVKHAGRDGTQPYGLHSYDAGVYTTVTEDGTYTSEDAVTWTLESASNGALLPDDISEDGQWGMAKDFLTGTLLRYVGGEWQVAPRPPQADQTGDWVWMRHLASSGDILLVIGGPPDPLSDDPYPVPDTAAYWTIDSSGEWQKTTLGWDGSFSVGSVPAGGFAYSIDDSVYTSVDGITWIDRGTTRFPFWEDGVFPGLLHATIRGEEGDQVWASPDAVTWTYQFTTPTPDYNNTSQHLDLTNSGFVVTQLITDDAEEPTPNHVKSWQLNGDHRSWTALTPFKFPGCKECATAWGAVGDVIYVSQSTTGRSATTYLANLGSG